MYILQQSRKNDWALIMNKTSFETKNMMREGEVFSSQRLKQDATITKCGQTYQQGLKKSSQE